MSSSLPPAGPPDGPPGPPPGGPPPPPPEYLTSGAGQPLPPEPSGTGRGGMRKGVLVGGGVAALALVGVGAWAAVSFFSTGPQPAQALPSSTLAYASVDLDPSGGQKIEALRTLNKFPAFEDGVGIDTDDDIRERLFEELRAESGCDGLDYADDVEPWLGDRAAVAAVDTGDDQPVPVFVLQVSDADAADDGLAALRDCAEGDELGWAIDGEWAVLAETDDIAKRVSDDAAEESLADDDDFARWTGEAGDAGIATFYASPALGDYLADHAEDLFGFPLAMGASLDCVATPELGAEPGVVEDPYESCGDTMGDTMADSGAASAVSDEMKQQLQDFQGMAGIVRFSDGAIELELAADGAAAGDSLLASDEGGEAISSLPSDTAFALGVGFADGWFGELLDLYAPALGAMGPGMTVDDLVEELETETGLSIPEDVESLVGDSAAIAVGPDFDPDTFFSSGDGSDVPIALKVQGDADEVEAVLDKLRAQLGEDGSVVLGSDADGDVVVIGPSADYRAEVLEDGGLGDDDVFRDVVREADGAAAVLFVNVNQIEDAIVEGLGETDDELAANLEPISGFGITGYVDDGVAHSVMRLTTD